MNLHLLNTTPAQLLWRNYDRTPQQQLVSHQFFQPAENPRFQLHFPGIHETQAMLNMWCDEGESPDCNAHLKQNNIKNFNL